MADLKVFNRWASTGIEVNDAGLKKYIQLEAPVVPKTYARFVGSRFHKSKISLVERLINKVQVPGHKAKKHFRSSGHCTGKGLNSYRLVEQTFQIIEQKTKKNPVDVFVQAVVNGAPREEIITIEYGGARYPKALECAPQRRIDIALRLMVQGSYQKSFNSKKPFSQCLADEIIAASQQQGTSVIISKKHEMERQADASR